MGLARGRGLGGGESCTDLPWCAREGRVGRGGSAADDERGAHSSPSLSSDYSLPLGSGSPEVTQSYSGHRSARPRLCAKAVRATLTSRPPPPRPPDLAAARPTSVALRRTLKVAGWGAVALFFNEHVYSIATVSGRSVLAPPPPAPLPFRADPLSLSPRAGPCSRPSTQTRRA